MSFLTMIVATSLASAFPASGSPGIASRLPPEPRPLPTYRPATNQEARVLRDDIAEGRRAGELSRRDARHLRRELREIGMLEDRYASGGLTDAERAELRARIEVVRALTRGKRLGTLK